MKSLFEKAKRPQSALIALAAILLVLATGMAIDYGRFATIRSAAQVALDRSVRAAATEAELNRANGPAMAVSSRVNLEDALYSEFSLTQEPSGVIRAAASLKVPTVFLRFAGITTLNAKLHAEGVGKAVERLSQPQVQAQAAPGN